MLFVMWVDFVHNLDLVSDVPAHANSCNWHVVELVSVDHGSVSLVIIISTTIIMIIILIITQLWALVAESILLHYLFLLIVVQLFAWVLMFLNCSYIRAYYRGWMCFWDTCFATEILLCAFAYFIYFICNIIYFALPQPLAEKACSILIARRLIERSSELCLIFG